MLIDANPKFYFEGRNLKSIPDCLPFETVPFKNMYFETVGEFKNFRCPFFLKKKEKKNVTHILKKMD